MEIEHYGNSFKVATANESLRFTRLAPQWLRVPDIWYIYTYIGGGLNLSSRMIWVSRYHMIIIALEWNI